MSRSKARSVFGVRNKLTRVTCYVIARHSKGALTIARQLRPGFTWDAPAFEVGEDMAKNAINLTAKETA